VPLVRRGRLDGPFFEQVAQLLVGLDFVDGGIRGEAGLDASSFFRSKKWTLTSKPALAELCSALVAPIGIKPLTWKRSITLCAST